MAPPFGFQPQPGRAGRRHFRFNQRLPEQKTVTGNALPTLSAAAAVNAACLTRSAFVRGEGGSCCWPGLSLVSCSRGAAGSSLHPLGLPRCRSRPARRHLLLCCAKRLPRSWSPRRVFSPELLCSSSACILARGSTCLGECLCVGPRCFSSFRCWPVPPKPRLVLPGGSPALKHSAWSSPFALCRSVQPCPGLQAGEWVPGDLPLNTEQEGASGVNGACPGVQF